MRILFLSPRQCWPPLTGAKLRDFHFARALGSRAELTYVFFSQNGTDTPGVRELPFCRTVVAVPPPPKYTPVKIARGVVGRWPLSVLNFLSAEMARALEKLTRAADYDVVHLECMQLAGYIPLLRGRLRAPSFIHNWHNIESELLFRYAESSGSPPRRVYAALTGRRLARLEDQELRSARGHIVCSERERGALLARVPDACIEIIGNGVDVDLVRMDPGGGARNRVLFVGSMGYHANIEAAVFFTRRVWPQLRQRFPQWRLTLVGTDPSPEVIALSAEPSVEVTGTVPDVRPYYREAVAAIAPLQVGGGTRLKILEGMAAGVPVISTALGAEGLDLVPGREILIAEREDEWINAFELLQCRPDLKRSIVDAALRVVETRYDWKALGERLYATYSEWLGVKSQRPVVL